MPELTKTWHAKAVSELAEEMHYPFLIRWGEWAGVGYQDPNEAPSGVKPPDRVEVALVLGFLLGITSDAAKD